MMQRQQMVHPIESLGKVVEVERFLEFQKRVRQVHLVESVRRYILNLIHATRAHSALTLGASPRGSLALYRTAQAYAALQGRDFVIPDDVKHMAISCLAHRLVMNPENILSGENTTDVVRELLKTTEVPVARSGVSHPT
jgi:MoxR-like ATPase